MKNPIYIYEYVIVNVKVSDFGCLILQERDHSTGRAYIT